MNPFSKGKPASVPAPTPAPSVKPATGPALPRIDDAEELAPLLAKAAELRAGRLARADRVADLERQLRHISDTTDDAGPTERAALALIDGNPLVPADAGTVRAELANARGQYAAYDEAVNRYDREHVKPARHKAAKRIAEGLFPEWRQQVRETAGHVLSFHRAAVALANRRDVFDIADVHVSPLGPDPLGTREFTDAGDHADHFKRIARDLVEAGFADAGEPLVTL